MISVITPAYNASKYIGQAIESVQTQGIDEFEMLIIDDGSTDETREIVLRYADKDPRIVLLQNEHKGVSEARNRGLVEAKFDWIALLDADDVFLHGKLSKQLESAKKNPEVIAWGTYAFNVGESGKIYDVTKTTPTDLKGYQKMLSAGDVFMPKNSSVLFRKSVLDKMSSFESKYDSSEDIEFWSRMAAIGPIVVVPEPLILYRLHPKSLSVLKTDFQFMCVKFLRARNLEWLSGKDLSLEEFLSGYRNRPWYERIVDYATMKSNGYWRNAGLMAANGNKALGMYWLARSILANPFLILWRLVLKAQTAISRIFL
jgi:glycosyltransferase involved in cell wall biosynthesis